MASRRSDVSRETLSRLEAFEGLVKAEALHQNLIASSTIDQIAMRHTDDSLQLIRLLPDNAETIIDIGSGAGFPGVVLAIVTDRAVTLNEPRALRVRFLREATRYLQLANVDVIGGRAEAITGRRFDIITARAVASLDRLLGMTHHLAHPGTIWILPKGRGVQTELAAARRSWQGAFEVRPSLTSADAGIVVARNIRPRRAA